MGDTLRLSLLGGLQIERGGLPVTGFVSTKAPALLAYLAVTGRPHLRAALAGLLWADSPESEALGSLRKVLSNLRRVVGPWLASSGDSVTFDRGVSCWLDVEAFEQSVADAGSLGPGSEGPEGRFHAYPLPGWETEMVDGLPAGAGHLQTALDLYRGDFLAGFYVRGAPEFEEWVACQRIRLSQMALQAAGDLSWICARGGKYGRALECTGRILSLAPWSEEAHRWRMELLARAGQRAAALAQFQICQRMLRNELAVEPSEETADLHARILGAGAPRPNNLPAQTAPIMGREVECAELLWRLMRGARLVTLVGPGGVGKTRLALEVAGRAVREGTGTYADGVYLVSLMDLDAAEGLIPAIARTVGLSFHGGREERHQLADYWRRRRMLLLLDNCEHLEGCAEAVSALLSAGPCPAILATSHARLGLQGEQVFPVGGLRVPAESVDSAEDVATYEAVQLFEQAARRASPVFDLEREARGVAQVCRLAEGMPLAILLVAAWARVLSAMEMARELERGLDILAGGGPDLPERHRSQRAVFEATWQMLSQRERRLLAALSVFRGRFSREAACGATGASLDEVRSLVDRSLVRFVAEGQHLLHDLLRRFAAEKLAECPGDEERARDGHCDYYSAWLKSWEADLRGPRQHEALAAIDEEVYNLSTAWAWAVTNRRESKLDQAAEGLGLYYLRQARLREGAAAFEGAVESLRGPGVRPSPRVLARILRWQGRFSWELREAERASALLAQAVALLDEAEAAGESVQVERANLLMCEAALVEGSDHKQARFFFGAALALFREAGDAPGIANALHGLGRMAWYSGSHGEAARLRGESLALTRAAGAPQALAESLTAAIQGALYDGRLEEAELLAAECVPLRLGMGDRHNLACARVDSARLCLWSGRFSEASSLYREAVEIWTDLGARPPAIQVAVASAELLGGAYEAAAEWANWGLTGGPKGGDRRAVGLARLVLGAAALARGRLSEGLPQLRESVAVLRALEQRTELGWALACLAFAERLAGGAGAATQCAQEALETGALESGYLTILFALPAIALLRLDQGRVQRAVELYALASSQPFVANSAWFEEVAGRAMGEASKALEPSLAAAARERGRARDLRATVAELLDEMGRIGKPGAAKPPAAPR